MSPLPSHLAISELSLRSRKILLAAVTEFIATGDPVGSRTLARRYGLDLSAASIRNVLADLEEAGYLHQPHTSAGRIPTDQALRLFIDTLMEVRPISYEQRAELVARVAEIYGGAKDPLRETGRYLSELSGAVAVVAAPRTEFRALSQLRFIPTKPGQLVAILVFVDGSVENRFIKIDEEIAEPELMTIHNLLAEVIEGRTLGQVRDLFVSQLGEERLAVDALGRRALDLGSKATADVDRRGEVVIEGKNRLLALPEYGDVERVKQLIKVLEEREELVELLDKTLAAGAGAITVFVGSEAGDLGAGQLSLVAAPYTDHGRVAGTVGVLGPTRMDYAKVMPLVDATALAVSEAITKAKT